MLQRRSEPARGTQAFARKPAAILRLTWMIASRWLGFGLVISEKVSPMTNMPSRVILERTSAGSLLSSFITESMNMSKAGG